MGCSHLWTPLKRQCYFTVTIQTERMKSGRFQSSTFAGVLEVKASLNATSARLAVSKLQKLYPFVGQNESQAYPTFLCEPFVCGTVFFETNVDNLNAYRRALDELTLLYSGSPILPFLGSLIIASQKNRDHSGYLRPMISDTPLAFDDVFELSSGFRYPNGKFGAFGAFCYSVNEFQGFLFDLLACLRGALTNRVSSFYGLDFENATGSRLFH